jgi:hypothetical protein
MLADIRSRTFCPLMSKNLKIRIYKIDFSGSDLLVQNRVSDIKGGTET